MQFTEQKELATTSARVASEQWSVGKRMRSCSHIVLVVYVSARVVCAYGLMVGLPGCASHGIVIQSRGWLPNEEAPGYTMYSISMKRCNC